MKLKRRYNLIILRFVFDRRSIGLNLYYFASRKMSAPFSVATDNVELRHECSPQHLRMGTARMK